MKQYHDPDAAPFLIFVILCCIGGFCLSLHYQKAHGLYLTPGQAIESEESRLTGNLYDLMHIIYESYTFDELKNIKGFTPPAETTPEQERSIS